MDPFRRVGCYTPYLHISLADRPSFHLRIIMEVTVKTNDLAQVLRLAQAATERRITIPVLGTVLLTAESNGLVVTGTDLELGAVCRCPAQIKKPGSLAVPAQRLTEYVKMLPEGDLFLKQDAEKRCGDGNHIYRLSFEMSRI